MTDLETRAVRDATNGEKVAERLYKVIGALGLGAFLIMTPWAINEGIKNRRSLQYSNDVPAYGQIFESPKYTRAPVFSIDRVVEEREE